MNVGELRTYIEPYLNSRGYEKTTRSNNRSYISLYLKFLETSDYEEMSSESVFEYMKPYIGKPLESSRRKRCEEFVEYVRKQQKEEQQINMFEENEMIDEPLNEVANEIKADTDSEETSGTSMPYIMTAPRSSDADAVDMAKKEAVANSSVQETSTSKGKGRPKKAESDKRKNSFSVYLSESSAEALKDLARYDRKDVSVLLAEIIEMFISKNEDILTEYRTFYKNRRQLRQ